MRTLVRLTIDTEAGNEMIRSGRLPQVLQELTERIRPEASYFYSENGMRTAMFFFDMKDASEIPSIAEPAFQELGAAVEFFPVMNGNDLAAGLQKLPR